MYGGRIAGYCCYFLLPAVTCCCCRCNDDLLLAVRRTRVDGGWRAMRGGIGRAGAMWWRGSWGKVWRDGQALRTRERLRGVVRPGLRLWAGGRGGGAAPVAVLAALAKRQMGQRQAWQAWQAWERHCGNCIGRRARRSRCRGGDCDGDRDGRFGWGGSQAGWHWHAIGARRAPRCGRVGARVQPDRQQHHSHLSTSSHDQQPEPMQPEPQRPPGYWPRTADCRLRALSRCLQLLPGPFDCEHARERMEERKKTQSA